HLGARARRLPHLERHRGGPAHALRGGGADQEEVRRRLGAPARERRRDQRASVGGRRPRQVSRKLLCEIIEPRGDEILTLARQVIVKAGLEDQIPGGVVLTGGCAALEGLTDLAEEIFEAPVRLGTPSHIGGLQDVVRGPMYATGVGLVLYGATQAR